MPNALLVILGNQLFPISFLRDFKSTPVFMAEDRGLCTHFKYHKHKIILFLSAMRAHADELRKHGWHVDYRAIDSDVDHLTYEGKLIDAVRIASAQQIITFEIEDRFFESRIESFCKSNQIELKILPSPMFLTSREDFAQHLKAVRKPFMKTFYAWQRRRLNVMIDERGMPTGGQFSFDADNRKALPPIIVPPEPTYPTPTLHVRNVSKIVDKQFADHPGDSSDFWLPTTRRGSLSWLKEFLDQRFAQFGPFEDAIPQMSTFVFHSVLSPLLNLGLLTPTEVIKAATVYAEANLVPIESLEGFVRQIIGWREFIRGIYQNYSAKEESRNFFGHQKKLSDIWYTGHSGIPPLDCAIKKILKFGWCHHIERLMVISNLMLLCEIHPRESHRWFMEMFVDSSDWVMGPNVYGMGQFSDGGIFATKPYLCGSNYFLKMGDFEKGEWCDAVDGLYWGFIERNRAFFERNPRTIAMARNVDRITADRKQKIFKAAQLFKKRATI